MRASFIIRFDAARRAARRTVGLGQDHIPEGLQGGRERVAVKVHLLLFFKVLFC